jgi:hypothetical protein
VWGLAGLVSGDVPVTKRIDDAGRWAVGGIGDAADAVSEAGGALLDKGRGLLDGAKGVLGFG